VLFYKLEVCKLANTHFLPTEYRYLVTDRRLWHALEKVILLLAVQIIGKRDIMIVISGRPDKMKRVQIFSRQDSVFVCCSCIHGYCHGFVLRVDYVK